MLCGWGWEVMEVGAGVGAGVGVGMGLPMCCKTRGVVDNAQSEASWIIWS